VREDAEAVAGLATARTNVPLHEYLDQTSLNALCDSLSLEPDQWLADDLEKILIIRDGLYDLRHALRDKGDDAEHSIDQFLSAVDRLYADLERALREFNQNDCLKRKGRLRLCNVLLTSRLPMRSRQLPGSATRLASF
jgi:hypothetical protein